MLEKLKELTKETAIYGISTIVGRFLAFMLVPFYTNFLVPSEFGIFAYVYAYIAFLNIFYIYGMDAAFMKYSSLSEEAGKKDAFTTPFIFVLGTSGLLSAVMYSFQDTINYTLNIPEEHSYIFYFVIFILFFDTVALIPFANLRLQKKAAKFALVKIFNILINITLNVVLIVYYEMGIKAIFISNLVASIFSFVALLPEIARNFHFRLRFDLLKKMLKFGIPYLPASLAAMMVQVIDRPILRSLTDDATLGIYQANYKLGIFMMLFVSMFQYAWQPFFLTNAKESNAKEIFGKVLTLFTLVSSIILVTLSLFIEDIARIEIINGKTLIGSQYLSGLVIVPIILFGYLFHGLYVNFTAGIYIEEKTKYFPIVTGAGAMVNIAVNFSLIPVLGMVGAALATIASYFVMAVGLYFVSQRFYRIEYEFGKLAKIFLIITVIGILYYYLLSINLLLLPVKFILLIAFFTLIILFRVVKRSEIIYVAKMLISKRKV